MVCTSCVKFDRAATGTAVSGVVLEQSLSCKGMVARRNGVGHMRCVDQVRKIGIICDGCIIAWFEEG